MFRCGSQIPPPPPRHSCTNHTIYNRHSPTVDGVDNITETCATTLCQPRSIDNGDQVPTLKNVSQTELGRSTESGITVTLKSIVQRRPYRPTSRNVNFFQLASVTVLAFADASSRVCLAQPPSPLPGRNREHLLKLQESGGSAGGLFICMPCHAMPCHASKAKQSKASKAMGPTE